MSKLYHALEAYKDYCSRKPRTKRVEEFITLARNDVLAELDVTRKRIKTEIFDIQTQDLLIAAFENQVNQVLENVN